jgi:hypothetical protein
MQQVYIGWRIPGFRKFLKIMQSYELSSEAQYRLSVLQWHFSEGEKNSTATARHFGLHRNTVGKWQRIPQVLRCGMHRSGHRAHILKTQISEDEYIAKLHPANPKVHTMYVTHTVKRDKYFL